jgi:hypothetical protein
VRRTSPSKTAGTCCSLIGLARQTSQIGSGMPNSVRRVCHPSAPDHRCLLRSNLEDRFRLRVPDRCVRFRTFRGSRRGSYHPALSSRAVWSRGLPEAPERLRNARLGPAGVTQRSTSTRLLRSNLEARGSRAARTACRGSPACLRTSCGSHPHLVSLQIRARMDAAPARLSRIAQECPGRFGASLPCTLHLRASWVKSGGLDPVLHPLDP